MLAQPRLLSQGQYAHTHGITDNTDRSSASHRIPTFPRALHESGYETVSVGKWHMGVDDSPRPRSTTGWVFSGRVLTLARHAVDVISRNRAKPLCLWLAHKAVHPEVTQFADGSVSDPTGGELVPAERHKSLFARE